MNFGFIVGFRDGNVFGGFRIYKIEFVLQKIFCFVIQYFSIYLNILLLLNVQFSYIQLNFERLKIVNNNLWEKRL